MFPTFWSYKNEAQGKNFLFDRKGKKRAYASEIRAPGLTKNQKLLARRCAQFLYVQIMSIVPDEKYCSNCKCVAIIKDTNFPVTFCIKCGHQLCNFELSPPVEPAPTPRPASAQILDVELNWNYIESWAALEKAMQNYDASLEKLTQSSSLHAEYAKRSQKAQNAIMRFRFTHRAEEYRDLIIEEARKLAKLKQELDELVSLKFPGPANGGRVLMWTKPAEKPQSRDASPVRPSKD